MDPFALADSPQSDVAVFNGNTVNSNAPGWHVWTKPPGKTYVSMTAIAGGGGGGAGVIGANSTAAGGGGGASGGMTTVEMPLALLPSRLYVSVGAAVAGVGVNSIVSIWPTSSLGFGVVSASGGNVGGAASGATAGSGGSGVATTASAMPLGWAFLKTALGGQAGTTGGTTGNGTSLVLPVTGLRATGGTGGGGLPAAATNGASAGSFTVPASPSYFPAQSGGIGSATATIAADPGRNGFRVDGPGLHYYYGGTGGASTHGTATGAGLTQARGGNGGIGSGGGGSGGALTGSAAATPSKGGPGLVIITCY